jgi:formyltetrahydrofolate-dependent phosphoribosylglycinamide formyltransferase
MEATPRLVVMASGAGTNLQAVIDATAAGVIPAEVVAVISDVPTSGALQRAESAGIPAVFAERRRDESRHDYDSRVAVEVAEFRPDWVLLAGWMRLLTATFLDRFPNRVVNLHPALPGDLPGVRSIERAFDESRHGLRSHSGVMVHLVPDEGVDNGPVLSSTIVPIHQTDTIETFASRMHRVEHELLVTTLASLCSDAPNPTGVTP